MSETLRLTVVYEDAGDGWIMASIPQLPAVLTQGASIDEARAMIRSALRDWLEFYVRLMVGEHRRQPSKLDPSAP
ncbi:MAG: type II toxin-antitoxin system HicB family antitoxin [Egibacteraceae bacterium]